MPYNIILYFRLLYVHVSNCALFSTLYFSTLILYRRSLDHFYYLFTRIYIYIYILDVKLRILLIYFASEIFSSVLCAVIYPLN